ncbi:hypothetical protein M1N08_00690 [Dehalococcoidia bacterium]|nr:hypothetical protein [Dehalococcoidia bacterium]
MTKRSHQTAARYAKRRGKRKRSPKSHPPSEANLASQQTEDVQPRQVTEPMPETGDWAATYAYVASDLKRTGMIGGAIFALLIVLAIIFG